VSSFFPPSPDLPYERKFLGAAGCEIWACLALAVGMIANQLTLNPLNARSNAVLSRAGKAHEHGGGYPYSQPLPHSLLAQGLRAVPRRD